MRAKEAVSDTAASLNAAGFHAFLNPAARTEAGGLSAGTAVLSKWHCGAYRVCVQGVELPDPTRFLPTRVDAVVKGGIVVCSLYLKDGVGIDAFNAQLLDRVSAYLVAVGLPFIIGADWNNGINDIVKLGWLQALDAFALAPSGNTYTSGEAATCIDFFAISNCLADAVVECRSVATTIVKKHSPVKLVMSDACRNKRVDVLKTAPRMSVELVPSCRAPPLDWTQAKLAAEEAVRTGEIDDAYGRFMDNFEREVFDLVAPPSAPSGEPVRKPDFGKRSGPPRVKNIHAFDACKGQLRGRPEARTWRCLQDILRGLGEAMAEKRFAKALGHSRKLVAYKPPLEGIEAWDKWRVEIRSLHKLLRDKRDDEAKALSSALVDWTSGNAEEIEQRRPRRGRARGISIARRSPAKPAPLAYTSSCARRRLGRTHSLTS